MKKAMFILIVVLLVGAFGISAYQVGSYLIEGREQEKRNEELLQMTQNVPSVPAATDSQEETGTPVTFPPLHDEATGILTNYLGLYELNDDTVGWIQIPNTKLNYVVMQTPEEPDFYLNRDFDKEDSDRGTIFAWGTADLNKPSDNITLFGHNMRDGSMFAALNDYENKYFWEDNSLILFNTLREFHTYKIFAVFKTTATLGEGFAYHQFVDAKDEADFKEFVDTCKKLSLYETDEYPEYGEKLICLSTCAYHAENGRLVVAAYRIT